MTDHTYDAESHHTPESRERDALEAENQRLREALLHLRGAYDCADVVDAALKGDSHD